jgi:hypothetical protein
MSEGETGEDYLTALQAGAPACKINSNTTSIRKGKAPTSNIWLNSMYG